MEQTPLEDIFTEDETATPVAEAPEQPEVDARPRDEHGRFAAKEPGVEPQDTAPSEPPSDKLPPDTFKGLKEEREKRQKLEQELEALRQHIQAAQQEPPAPPPSIWEDEQGAFQAHAQAIAAQTSLNARLDMSEMLASQAHDDFDQMKEKFVQMMQMNPSLQQKALAAKHPWEEAYRIAKNAATIEEIGATDLDTLKAKLREELMAEMQTQAPAMPNVPPSLTAARNVGTRTGPAWTGPKSLDDLLG